MLKISKLADYSTVIMSFLARNPGQLFSASLISHKTAIAVPTVSKVLKLLHEAKLLTSLRGVNGGYQLAKEPQNISLAEIINAIDGVTAITQCSKGSNICDHDQICHIRGNWQRINHLISNILQEFSLADMSKPFGDLGIPLHFYPRQIQPKVESSNERN